MARLTLKERARIAALALDRSRRSVVAGMLHSPVLRWRYGASGAEQLLIVPQDLRTADPSFWREVKLDQFGLAGIVAPLDGASPFELTPPAPAWARALHGFGWLRHLDATGDAKAREAARMLVRDWIGQRCGERAPGNEPAVLARRLISWISHAELLLEGGDAAHFDIVTRSLSDQLKRLAATWRDAPDGYPRLLSLIALVLADLCLAGHDKQLADAEQLLMGELARQILPDGGHISRNAAVLVEIMLDLLPLRQCFASRSRPVPDAIAGDVRRILAMLRYMRLGDGKLARFNGTGIAAPAGLATVVAYDDLQLPMLVEAPHSRYQRLECGDTILIVDCGPPPPLETAADAHAGCLSFEMSSGSCLLFVNGGAPGGADQDWRAASRATASHNTVCLAETSSSRLVRHATLESLLGSAPIRGPDHVDGLLTLSEVGPVLEAHHNGYLERFGLLHHRSLWLSADGMAVRGCDRLQPPHGMLRLARDLPFAVHFHLHPSVGVRLTGAPAQAELTLADGRRWLFSADGAQLAVEESIFYADSIGPSRALQIVLRGTTFGDSEVLWTLNAQRAGLHDAPPDTTAPATSDAGPPPLPGA